MSFISTAVITAIMSGRAAFSNRNEHHRGFIVFIGWNYCCFILIHKNNPHNDAMVKSSPE